MTKIAYRLDTDNPLSLTEEQKKMLAGLETRPVDYSDLPPLDDAFWKNAVQNPFYRPTKQSTTLRLDSDVLAWLKGQGKGYQTRINAILREAMIRSIR